jgi:hypothetical protein
MNILLLLVGITAGPRNATVMGTVTNDLDRSAIAGALVVLWELHAEDSAVTDSLGFYSLRLTPGGHSLRASYQDYVPAVSGFAVDSGQRLRVDFQIHPKPIEMPSREVISAKKPLRHTDTTHNDSVLRLLSGLRFTGRRTWTIRENGVEEPDSGSIRRNNETMKAAMLAFERRQRLSLFKRQPSCFLQCDGYYLIIDRGRCRLVVDWVDGRYRTVNVFDVDSLRLRPDDNTFSDFHATPTWGTLPQYVPLQIEVFLRGRYWVTVFYQHVIRQA